jgi:predicted transcriptional regulator
MKMESVKLTVEDILDDLENNRKKDVSGITAEEFANELGIGLKKAQKTLKKLVQSGRMSCERKEIVDVTGRKNYTYVYDLKR